MTGKQKLDDLFACVLVEVSCRLVRDNDGRIWRKRACNRYTLLLTAGQLRRIVVESVAQPDSGEFVTRLNMGVGNPGQFQRHCDIFECRHCRDQMKRLENDPDMATAKPREGILVEGAKILPCNRYVSRVGPFETGHYHQ